MDITIITVILITVAIWGGVLCFTRNPIVAALFLIFFPLGLLFWAFVEVIGEIFR
jgi:hypothetical protein